jgi:hypothetical protein
MKTKSKNVSPDSAVGTISILNGNFCRGMGIILVKGDFNGLSVPSNQKHCISVRSKQAGSYLPTSQVCGRVNQVAGGFEEMIVSSGQGLQDFIGDTSDLVLLGFVPGRNGILPYAA